MIFDMLTTTFRLAGRRDSRQYTGLAFKALEVIFSAAPYVFLYLVLRQILDGRTDLVSMAWLIGGLAACMACQYVFCYLSSKDTYVSSYDLARHIRLRQGEHIRKLPMGFFSANRVGDVNDTMTTGISHVEGVFSHKFPMLVSSLSLPIALAALMILVDWRMALATLSTVPLAIPMFIWSLRVMKKRSGLRAIAQVDSVSRCVEYVQGIKIIKSFNVTGKRFNSLRQSLWDFREASVKLEAFIEIPLLVYTVIVEAGFIVVLLAGTYLLFGGQVTAATFFMFLVLSLGLYRPIQELAVYAAVLKLYSNSVEKIERLEAEKEIKNEDKGSIPGDFRIEFKGVTFGYGQATVLHDVTFTVPEKSIVALVGPSGSGKTTIMNLIARFWDIDKGEILIGGVNVKDMSPERLLSYMSMVFQDVYLFNDTILNNIKIGRQGATREEVSEAARAAGCHEFISKLPAGYDTMVGEGGCTLSGGEKQRISIARAILKDAPILLLDEATASMDPENEVIIQSALDRLTENKTIFLIAHRLSTVMAADKIIVLAEGRVIEESSHEGLLAKNGLYRRLWESQQKSKGWRIGG